MRTDHAQPGSAAVPANVLEMCRIRHRYPRGSREASPAVDDVSLEVAANEVVCLLGPSGCGKTTLLRIAAGLEPLQEGCIRLRGTVVAEPEAGIWIPPERRHVGLVFQDSALFPHLSVLGNVTFGLTELPARDRERQARALLEQLHVASHAEAFPHQLSGGEQQRVALARALAPQPSLMLMDEPFASLDAGLRSRIRDDVLEALSTSGTATVLVTHDPEEALFMADRIALMRAGRIVQIGHPQDLYCHPANAFVARFFGDVNELAGRVTNGAVTTAFGPIPARACTEGDEVRVLIRPEALRVARVLEDSAEGGHARVVAARLLGRFSQLHLCVHDAEAGDQHLHAHVPGVMLLRPGQAVELSLDASQVFVFPAPPASPA